MTSLRDHAIALTEAGIPVFPCVVDGKEPATAKGFHEATTDLDRVHAWWNENPNYNIGVVPESAGWCVVDLDPGGEASWVSLLSEHGQHEPTYEVETPRGGRHLYFSGSLPSGASRLGFHVDTRGRGGYVLVPPSVVNGKTYRVLHDRDIANVPGWIAPILAERNTKALAASGELDGPASLGRAKRLLADSTKRGDVAISGQGGNDRTYRLSAELLNLGLSVETAYRLLLDEWNPHCDPPWDDMELLQIVTNADNYAQNEQGAWTVGNPMAAFGNTDAVREALRLGQPKRSRFHLRDEAEQDSGTDPAWLVPELIQEASTVLLVGPTQSYKSFLALDIALSVAAGVSTFGVDPQQGVTVYAALEGLKNIERQRRRSWRAARSVEKPIGDFYTTVAPAIGFPGEMEEFGDQVKQSLGERNIRLIVIDTLTKSMAGLNENDSRDAGAFVKFCDNLVEAFNCSVIAIHHAGKDTTRGARGSSAFHAGFDTVLEVKKVDGQAKAVEVWVKKHKDAEERGTPWTFKGRTVGQSLVFDPTTQDEHNEIIIENEPYAPIKVGRCLIARDACTRPTALSTTQLSVALLGRDAIGEERPVRDLERLAATTLRAYCEQTEDGLIWWIDRTGGTSGA